MESDLEILRYGFGLKYEKLSKTQKYFQNEKQFERYGWIPNSNLPKLMKNPYFGDLS